MATCPRCGAQNDPDRAACWNCFAPLSGALANRVKPMVLVGNGAAPAEAANPAAEPAAAPDQPKKKGLFGKK